MTQNKVMKLWTAIVTAFLALCTALGLVTATTAAASPQAPRTEEPCSSTIPVSDPLPPLLSRLAPTSLPPTMKQRIQAEAHGKSPGCRRRPLADQEASAPPEHQAPLQT
ncbi:DUF6344 domain-containing protein [Streptomyces sp. NPDC004542]|uniref:DUF6344 domain-containing protein n=1 Tax=Streptomyces sp. NPDC004542 TaxID=3154281 RepID=UPI0033B0680E